MVFLGELFFALSLIALADSQTCQNYGTLNGTECACPPGFGGSSCSQPGCGGDIFQGIQRKLAPTSSSYPIGNLTDAGCACESGWSGTGCNVCQSASSCQNALAASGHSQSSSSAASESATGQNNTMTCNVAPQVYASGQMSCQVVNPTLQAIFPLSSTLNILRTLQPALTPLPNVTGFGSAGSVYAQLFYEGVEQFYCTADTCSQTTNNNGTGSADWSCQNLQCTCIPNTTFCGLIPSSNLTGTLDKLGGTLGISCGALSGNTAQCAFSQSLLDSLFGASGLTLTGCMFGECVAQSVIDDGGNSTSTGETASTAKSLSGGVVAGLAVVGGLILLALALLGVGILAQRNARRGGAGFTSIEKSGGVGIEWTNVSYVVPGMGKKSGWFSRSKDGRSKDGGYYTDDKVVLDSVSGVVEPGQMMAVLGPSGAGKTTLVEILAGKSKSGYTTGAVALPSTSTSSPRIGFVPQQDILPPTLTVFEALIFAARLRLPENIPDAEKISRVYSVMEKLNIAALRDVRIGWSGEGGGKRGISGGEMRRVSIGLELVARPDVLILDEPTSGLDSVSAAKVASVLHAVAHDPKNPTAVIASIHQPSSQLYQKFDSILLLSHGRALYSGPGSFAPAEHLARVAPGVVQPYQTGYNVADYLLEVASDPPVVLFQNTKRINSAGDQSGLGNGSGILVHPEGDPLIDMTEKSASGKDIGMVELGKLDDASRKRAWKLPARSSYTATFLTQLEVLFGREWKILRRDKTLFIAHVAVAAVLGVFCGGLYYQTNLTIAGFQSRVGCLFFLGALIAFSALSALYNVVEIRPLFLRERSSAYYSPTAWLLSRFLFDVVPLRVIPTIIVASITYWMAGLAHDAAHFFKFLFILVLYSLAMTLFNFLLGTLFRNGGVAILLSALSALYQMTFAGFFVHLNSIPPVLRWLQWICPLKYTLEALSVNEVGSGLMIQDTLAGVPVDVSASLIMQLLFGFGLNNYYRDVLVLFGFIAGFGLGVIGVVWLKVRERR